MSLLQYKVQKNINIPLSKQIMSPSHILRLYSISCIILSC